MRGEVVATSNAEEVKLLGTGICQKQPFSLRSRGEISATGGAHAFYNLGAIYHQIVADHLHLARPIVSLIG